MRIWLRCCLIVIVFLTTEALAQEMICVKGNASKEIKRILVDTEAPSNLAVHGVNDPAAYVQSLKERYELYLLKNGFDIVERSKVKRLLDEQKFSTSGLTDNEKTYKIGKLLEADAILFIRITWYADGDYDEHLKLVDVVTGRSVCIGKFSKKSETEKGLIPNQNREQIIAEMVRKLFERQNK